MPEAKKLGKTTPVKATAAAPPKPQPKPAAPPIKPPVKGVTNPPSVVPGSEKVVITKNDIGVVPAGLVKSNQAPMKVNVPSFLQTNNMPETSNRQQTGYVGFASTQSKKWVMMQQAGLEDGQPFLYHQNSYIPLDTLDFFLCMGASYKTMMAGKDGTFIYATQDMNLEVPEMIYKGNVVKLEPHYVCLMLVAIGGSLIQIKGDFRGTKSGGIENAIRAVEAASDPEWIKLSEQHRATAAFPQPFGRVFHRITTKRGVSKSNGNPYYSANCNSAPASIGQMELLVKSLADDEFNNKLTEAYNNYNSRLEFLNNIVNQGDSIINGNSGGNNGSSATAEPVPF